MSARGIKTRYMEEKKGRIRRMLEVRKTPEEELFKLRQLEEVREESFKDLESAVREGRISGEDATRFWRDDFETEKDLFLRNGQTFDQFRANVARKRESHLKRFGKQLSMEQMLQKGERA